MAGGLTSLDSLSALTGGLSFIHADMNGALEQTARSTSKVYLLGYLPRIKTKDNRYRRIEVQVRRKGVKLFFRRGYYGNEIWQPYDRQDLTTYARTVQAAGYADPIQEIPFSFEVSKTEKSKKTTSFVANLTIKLLPDSLRFEGGLYRGKLSVTSFVYTREKRASGEARDRFGSANLISQSWDDLSLGMKEASLSEAIDKGFRIEKPFLVDEKLKNGLVKIVVYDPGSDRVGSYTQPIQ
jgi:hypothetical protein